MLEDEVGGRRDAVGFDEFVCGGVGVFCRSDEFGGAQVSGPSVDVLVEIEVSDDGDLVLGDL